MGFELSSRAVVLDNGLEYLFKTSLMEMVAIVGGDQNKAPLLLDMLLRKKDIPNSQGLPFTIAGFIVAAKR